MVEHEIRLKPRWNTKPLLFRVHSKAWACTITSGFLLVEKSPGLMVIFPKLQCECFGARWSPVLTKTTSSLRWQCRADGQHELLCSAVALSWITWFVLSIARSVFCHLYARSQSLMMSPHLCNLSIENLISKKQGAGGRLRIYSPFPSKFFSAQLHSPNYSFSPLTQVAAMPPL